MNALQKIDLWNVKHHFVFMDILRFALGLILVLKGVKFAADPQEVRILLVNGFFDPISIIFAHYIVMVHIAGGLMIMMGLLTRVSVVFQLPIVLGAVIFTGHLALFSFYNAATQAILVFVLLLIFAFYGSGAHSVDGFMKRHPQV
jgi:putative oxidoreductase